MNQRVQIVVPCYNEERRLRVDAFAQFLQGSPEVGFIVVNDGSTDGTLGVLHGMAQRFPDHVRVVDCAKNGGKAEAVRQGILAAVDRSPSRPAFVGYWDADLATPLPVILDFLRIGERFPHIDIVIGARVALLGRQIERKPSRHYLGRVFATGASHCLNLPVYDTQCGAKLVRVSDRTAACFREPFMSRWIFDVEMLARYISLGGTKHGLYEEAIPEWHDVAGSKVRPLDFIRAIREIVAIYKSYDLGQPLRSIVVPISGAFSLYSLVGVCGTAVHYLTLFVAVENGHLSPVAATALGATCGAITNYLLNYYFTFDSYRRHRETLPKFLVVTLIGIGVSSLGLYWASQLGIAYGLAQVVCTIIVLIIGFSLNRFWTFSDGDVDSAGPVAASGRVSARRRARLDRQRESRPADSAPPPAV